MNEHEISGRTAFLVAAAAVVPAMGAIGFVVGTTGQERGKSLSLLGVSLFEMTPGTMAVFGMALTVAVLVALAGLVSYASRRDAERAS